jgi:hypothetical protein
MTTHPHTDPDPTPAHGIERPPIPETDALAALRDRQMAEWQWPTSRNRHTWTDVARLIARLDSQAVAAGHPTTHGTLHLITPEEPGDHARIERRGSSDRVPGGSILPDNADDAHTALTVRLELYRDLADAGSDSARLYLIERGDQ